MKDYPSTIIVHSMKYRIEISYLYFYYYKAI